MSGLPFAFTYAPILFALLALPLIWLLLRVTPPKPKAESFPPTRLLLEIARKEEQPARTPWWLILLRCLLAAAVIVALGGYLGRCACVDGHGVSPRRRRLVPSSLTHRGRCIHSCWCHRLPLPYA